MTCGTGYAMYIGKTNENQTGGRKMKLEADYMAQLKIHKPGYYYVGRVHVWEGNKKLYSHSTGITRLLIQDALDDANILIKDIRQSNR